VTRILIVEDEPVLANNIARSLEKAGIDCLLAGSAAAARVALAEDQFDLVIADISLGDGNGLDVIAESVCLLRCFCVNQLLCHDCASLFLHSPAQMNLRPGGELKRPW